MLKDMTFYDLVTKLNFHVTFLVVVLCFTPKTRALRDSFRRSNLVKSFTVASSFAGNRKENLEKVFYM